MGACHSAPQVTSVSSSDALKAAAQAQWATQKKSHRAADPFKHILAGVPNCQQGGDVENVYALGRELGRGQYGVVRIATHRQTGWDYACKTLPKSLMTRHSHAAAARREVDIMMHVNDHSGIVGFIEAFEDKESIHIIMELCSEGMLFTKVNERGSFTEPQAADMLRQIVETLQYIHSRGVVHRDLKPENILIDADGKLKITDFGLASFVQKGELLTDVVGSAFYVAPETLRRRSSFYSDMWSAGVVLYILLSGEAPFYAQTEEGILTKVRKGEYSLETGSRWPRVSESAKDLVKKMMHVDPLERATPKDVLEHPWMQKHCGSALYL